MKFEPLPFRSNLDLYERQAAQLLDAYRPGDSDAIRLIHEHHPRFLDAKIPWLPRKVSDSEIREAGLDIADARQTIARCYDFANWPALTQYVGAVTQDGSPVFRFESAVEAMINGDVPALQSLIKDHPDLTRARSDRVTSRARKFWPLPPNSIRSRCISTRRPRSNRC